MSEFNISLEWLELGCVVRVCEVKLAASDLRPYCLYRTVQLHSTGQLAIGVNVNECTYVCVSEILGY